MNGVLLGLLRELLPCSPSRFGLLLLSLFVHALENLRRFHPELKGRYWELCLRHVQMRWTTYFAILLSLRQEKNLLLPQKNICLSHVLTLPIYIYLPTFVLVPAQNASKIIEESIFAFLQPGLSVPLCRACFLQACSLLEVSSGVIERNPYPKCSPHFSQYLFVCVCVAFMDLILCIPCREQKVNFWNFMPTWFAQIYYCIKKVQSSRHSYRVHQS